MSQSSPQQSSMSKLPMKKKIVIALVAVVVGHVGVLWGISHLKTATLVKIEKEPIKVKLVKLKEELAPPPPPPAVKPKVEPKPEPKPKPLPKPAPKPLPKPEPKPLPKPVEKPKVIAQKPEKTQPKAIQQVDRVEQQRLEQQRLDRLREQQQREQQLRDQQQREQQQREQQQLREQQQREQQQREQEARNRAQQPVKAQAGDISWAIKPKPNYDDNDLKGEVRSFTIYIEADEKGNIKKDKVRVVKSSGLPSLDAKIVAAVKRAKFKPYISNGVATPVYVEQPFGLEPSKAKK